LNCNFFFLCIVSLVLFISFEDVLATSEPILITVSPSMENVIFDGKWTNLSEWKQSSYNLYTFGGDEMIIHLRTAHFGDYIYVFIDPVNDKTLDKNMDEATVCLDGKNNKNKLHDTDDFCFSVLLEHNTGSVFQGNDLNDSITSMQKVSNPDNFIAISTTSDENDRYSKIPHPSYEFKIPIELLERSDNYGFYISVYDASLEKFYSWPENATRTNSLDFPSPTTWGDIISPDKSLPEMNLPIFVFSIMFFSIILIQSKIKLGKFY